MNGTTLRELVEARVDVRWSQWCARHPNLGAAIDRVRLVESAVASLEASDEYRAALRAADLDEAKLAAAARVLDVVERVVTRALPI